MKRAWLLFLLLVGGAAAAPAVLFQSAPGRFEIAAMDATAAQPILEAAQSAWSTLAAPLDLPAAFATPIFVRVVPPAEWGDAEPFRVIVEAGGVVSLRLRGGDTGELLQRRGIVQALLMRQAVARHGVRASLVAPLWLEFACVEAWRTGEEPSRRDALKQESAVVAPPSLQDVLEWRRGEPEPAERALGAYWLWVFLQAESQRGEEWGRLLTRLLGGEEPAAALAASFPERFANEAERELWWVTGWHEHRRVQTLPLLDAAESRALVADATRFVLLRDGNESVIGVAEWRGLARSGDGRGALRQHAARLEQHAAALHPFYRNAALALGRLFSAAREGPTKAFAAAQADFDREWRDASELEAESARALDALEQR